MVKESELPKGSRCLLFRSAQREVQVEPADKEEWQVLSLPSGDVATHAQIPTAKLGSTVMQKLALESEIPASGLPIEFESRRALGFIRRSTYPAHDWIWNFDVRCSDGSENCRGQESSLAQAIESCATACLKYERE